MELAITKISSKGQIVIPLEMRRELCAGEKLILIKSENNFILKKISDFEKTLEKDLNFAKRTENALKRIDKGKGIETDFETLTEDMKNW